MNKEVIYKEELFLRVLTRVTNWLDLYFRKYIVFDTILYMILFNCMDPEEPEAIVCIEHSSS